MRLEQVVDQLGGAAEPSRLRLLVALLSGETAVGDLVAVLEQSQPRVSRHLRLLAEAGLVESFREGRSIFYRWTAGGLAAGVASPVAALAAGNDPVIAADRRRQLERAAQRERAALRRALRTGQRGGLADAVLDKPLHDLLPALPADLLVIGCGAGELLGSLLPRVRLAAGLESSASLRELARARLHRAGLPHWTIRDPSATEPPFAPGSFDLIVLDVQAPAIGPEQLLAPLVAAHGFRWLRPTGQLVIHGRILPTDRDLVARLAAQLAGVGLAITHRQWLPGPSPDQALFVATPGQAQWGDDSTARTGTHD